MPARQPSSIYSKTYPEGSDPLSPMNAPARHPDRQRLQMFGEHDLGHLVATVECPSANAGHFVSLNNVGADQCSLRLGRNSNDCSLAVLHSIRPCVAIGSRLLLLYSGLLRPLSLYLTCLPRRVQNLLKLPTLFFAFSFALLRFSLLLSLIFFRRSLGTALGLKLLLFCKLLLAGLFSQDTPSQQFPIRNVPQTAKLPQRPFGS